MAPVERNIRGLIEAGYVVAFYYISESDKAAGYMAYAIPAEGRAVERAGDSITGALSILARDLRPEKGK